MQNNQTEKLVLENRKTLVMTNVSAVDGFNDQTLKLTVSDTKVLVVGEGLKITVFNKGDGNLTVEGIINEIKYSFKKQPVLKRIFK